MSSDGTSPIWVITLCTKGLGLSTDYSTSCVCPIDARYCLCPQRHAQIPCKESRCQTCECVDLSAKFTDFGLARKEGRIQFSEKPMREVNWQIDYQRVGPEIRTYGLNAVNCWHCWLHGCIDNRQTVISSIWELLTFAKLPRVERACVCDSSKRLRDIN